MTTAFARVRSLNLGEVLIVVFVVTRQKQSPLLLSRLRTKIKFIVNHLLREAIIIQNL